MKRCMTIPVYLGILLVLGACSTSNFYTLEDATEENLAKLTYPVPSEGLRVLRSSYIAGAVARYGVYAVRKYSGEHAEGDATEILGRLDTVAEELKQQMAEVTKSGFESKPLEGHQRYLEYVTKVLRLVGAAIEPTKRYYREHFFESLVAGNFVAAAETAFEGFRGIVKVAIWRRAITEDARGRTIDIMGRGRAAGSKTQQALLTEFQATCLASDEEAGTWMSQVKAMKSGLPWWALLPGDVRLRMCEDAKLSGGEKRLVAALLQLGANPMPLDGKPVPEDWVQADRMIGDACAS